MARMKSKPTMDELESERIRAITRAQSAERRADKLYEQLRLLENAVRDANANEKGESLARLIGRLMSRVPVNPRPTLYMIRRDRWRREHERQRRKTQNAA